jgi:hypothetical protein
VVAADAVVLREADEDGPSRGQRRRIAVPAADELAQSWIIRPEDISSPGAGSSLQATRPRR